MSRIGRKPLAIPSGVQVTVADGVVKVKGPKGELKQALLPSVNVNVDGSTLLVTVNKPDDIKERAYWGLFRMLIENMVEGVTKGFEKKLEAIGVGYKVAVAGKNLKLDVGYSHVVDFPIPEGVNVTVEKNFITVSGMDKQIVGETAARIRSVRKPEPYLGKGIKYSDEIIVRKAGKTAKS